METKKSRERKSHGLKKIGREHLYFAAHGLFLPGLSR
jgi:hypothetical protein